MRVGFLGFGEAARAFQESLATAAVAYGFAAYDIAQHQGAAGRDMRRAMDARAVAQMPDAAALTSHAEWLFSAVTADQSLDALRPLAPVLGAGQVVFDLNSVSPQRKRESARLVEAAGADYIDMAVMAPVHPRGHRTPVLLAGARAHELAPDLAAFGFDLRVVGDDPGAGTAIKMVRSLFVKGLEAITVETLLAAEASGCREEIVASLAASFEWFGHQPDPAYQFERTLRHGARRAAEMGESAATLDALGLHGGLAREIAAVQARMGDAGVVAPPDGQALDRSVTAVLRARLGSLVPARPHGQR